MTENLAAAEGNQEVVRLLLRHGADIHAQAGQYGTALQAAAAQEHEQVVRLLLELGADVNAKSGYYLSGVVSMITQTQSHCAIQSGVDKNIKLIGVIITTLVSRILLESKCF